MASPERPPVHKQQHQIPDEIWGHIISQHCLTNKDLKLVRLVSTAFRDFATPRLFDHITISLVRESIDALESIARNPHLAAMVRTIHLDNTKFRSAWDVRFHCQSISNHCADFLGLQNHGPLSARNLDAAMSSVQDAGLSEQHLSGSLRREFQRGYTLNQERAEYARSSITDDRFLRIFQRCLPPFTNLVSVKIQQDWTYPPEITHEQRCQMFKAYLVKHLPLETLMLIPGMSAEDQRFDRSVIPERLSFFDGPGIAAREMHPLWLHPSFQVPNVGSGLRLPIRDILLALESTNLHVRELRLPARAGGTNCWQNYIHPDDLGRWYDVETSDADDILVRTFSTVQYLTLGLNPWNSQRLTPWYYSNLTTCFSRGIQVLRNVKELRLAFRKVFPEGATNSAGFVVSWSVGTMFLRGLVPTTDNSDSVSDSDGELEDHAAQLRYYDALSINPWRNLSTLALVRMNTKFSDLCVLFKTVAPNLRTLELSEIRLLGSCNTCRSEQRYRTAHEGSQRCVDYMDVAVMIANVLSLDKCTIDLWNGDFWTIATRMGWAMTDETGEVVNMKFSEPDVSRVVSIGNVATGRAKVAVDAALQMWPRREQGPAMPELITFLDATLEAQRR